jgi:hypothetical protein
MILPTTQKKLTSWSLEIIDRCRVSVTQRANQARSIKTWVETGSPDGNPAILNRLYPHIDRLSSYLYSPNDLRFHIDFTHQYEKPILDQAEVASRALTRAFEQRDIDMEFGAGVGEALKFGACIPKAIHTHNGVSCSLVMPWQFGVYREDLNDLGKQEAVCETNYITPTDFWRRVSHLPNGPDLLKRAMAYARKQGPDDTEGSYFHSVLLAGTSPAVQTQPPFSNMPGGLVDVSGGPMGAILDPQVAQELICFHELWVFDDETEDYTTIQLVEPDILIAPLSRRKNLFVPDYLPYGLIQPNRMTGNFWGRSEIQDLMKLQHLLRDRLDDIKKLMSLQYDRIWAFEGGSGIQEETFDQMRESGYFTTEPGQQVKDVTPALPEEAFADIQEIMKFMDEVSGFQNILSGQGEPGVRAGNHAQTLLRTASPRLRDRALLVERQCADFADKIFNCMLAKDAKAYWPTRGEDFMLTQLPDDYRITVDSHSSSPIYEEDHKELVAFLSKIQAIDGESVFDLLNVPMRDILKARLKEQQEAKAQQMQKLEQEHPAEFLKVITGGKGKGH